VPGAPLNLKDVGHRWPSLTLRTRKRCGPSGTTLSLKLAREHIKKRELETRLPIILAFFIAEKPLRKRENMASPSYNNAENIDKGIKTNLNHDITLYHVMYMAHQVNMVNMYVLTDLYSMRHYTMHNNIAK